MKTWRPFILLLVVLGLFGAGVFRLLELRLGGGDVYPPYSSLRADPLGAMAFYESLGKLPGFTVSRDFSATDWLPEGPHTAYLHLGGEPGEFGGLSRSTYRLLQGFLARGGRLVITCAPYNGRSDESWQDEDADNENSPPPAAPVPKGTNILKDAKAPKGTNAPAPGKAKAEDPTKARKFKARHHSYLPPGETADWVDLEQEWGIHPSLAPLAKSETGNTVVPVSVSNRSVPGLPARLAWHSGLVYTNCPAEWRPVYVRPEGAVVIERAFGAGSVVLATDSFFLSNEALRGDRHADLLAWLVGPATTVVFDETHFGITESPGIAGLMRQYHLSGLVAGLLLLTGLYVWKNATSLAPAVPAGRPDGTVAGKDAQSGFVNLLRRNISPADLFATCYQEWKNTAAATGRYPASRRQAAEAAFAAEQARPPGQRRPLEAVRTVTAALAPKRD